MPAAVDPGRAAGRDGPGGRPPDPRRPIRPPGAPPRPGRVPDVPDDGTVLRDGAAGGAATAVAEPEPPAVEHDLVRPLPPAPPLAEPEPPPLPEAPPRLASAVLAHHMIGASPGRVRLTGTGGGGLAGAKARLEREAKVLPELDAEITPRKLWRQPAFLVSAGFAVAAVLVCGGLVIRQTAFQAPGAVEDVRLLDAGDNYVLEWSGPDVPYNLVLTTADGRSPGDISDYLKSWVAWIPKDDPRVTPESCLVLRYQADAEEGFSVDRATLKAQGGAMICVADAEDS